MYPCDSFAIGSYDPLENSLCGLYRRKTTYLDNRECNQIIEELLMDPRTSLDRLSEIVVEKSTIRIFGFLNTKLCKLLFERDDFVVPKKFIEKFCSDYKWEFEEIFLYLLNCPQIDLSPAEIGAFLVALIANFYDPPKYLIHLVEQILNCSRITPEILNYRDPELNYESMFVAAAARFPKIARILMKDPRVEVPTHVHFITTVRGKRTEEKRNLLSYLLLESIRPSDVKGDLESLEYLVKDQRIEVPPSVSTSVINIILQLTLSSLSNLFVSKN